MREVFKLLRLGLHNASTCRCLLTYGVSSRAASETGSSEASTFGLNSGCCFQELANTRGLGSLPDQPQPKSSMFFLDWSYRMEFLSLDGTFSMLDARAWGSP